MFLEGERGRESENIMIVHFCDIIQMVTYVKKEEKIG